MMPMRTGGIDMICKDKKVEVNGFTWFVQEFDRPDGNLEAVNLYDADGDFVCEFQDYNEMMHFIKDATIMQ